LNVGNHGLSAADAVLDLDGLRRALATQIAGEVRFDDITRALYSTDASVYRITPVGVVVPRSRDDILRVVELCREYRCPLTMRGGGTSQAGQSIGNGLIVDVSKYFNRLIEVNLHERWARVQPGIVLDELNAALKPHGLRFAPDISTASRATVGGMIANNSAGARSVLYGKTIDHVLELEVVLADGSGASLRPLSEPELDEACRGATLEARCYQAVRAVARAQAGEIERRFPKVLRRVGGYNLDEFIRPERTFNLAKLIVGSEGTLAVVVEAKIQLVPLPAAKAVLAIEFADLLEALDATPAILAHRPSAVEVMDRFILDHTRRSPLLERIRRSFISGEPGALLCVEFYADHADELPSRLTALERDLSARGHGGRYFHALTATAQSNIWSLREAALGLSMAMKGDAKSLSFVEDTAVAPERLRDYIDRFLKMVRAHGTDAGVYAHASVGCLHVRPVVNLKTESGVRTFESIARASADLVLEFGGALSGEHGDGLVRSPFMEKMFGSEIYAAFCRIKETFDPDGTFNPRKITDAPPLTANLRYGPDYRAATPPTFFDYGDHGGIAGAVEMCSGLGVCRKTLDGTMCPSYMVTREEKHSTRGRANALRLVLTGQIQEAGLGDHGLQEVLDLCLECRACKSECPVGVDVARFKSEFLADYWRRHGTPLRARVLGNVHRVARAGSRLPALANALSRSGVGRWLNERVVGIDRRRVLPELAARTFVQEFGRQLSAKAPTTSRPSDTVRRETGDDRAVLLFCDTFTNYYNPAVGIAGLRVLRRAGFSVDLAGNVCCGRPQISQGLLNEACRLAEQNVERLSASASAGMPLLLFEPSCLSAIREDVPALLRGDAQRRALAIAERAILFEDFLETAIAGGRTKIAFSPGPTRIVLHGHCHQKSMGRLALAQALLNRVPGATVVDLDAGCCGMAGSFGYAHEHYDVSRAIAERKLLPAARALQAGDVLVASGVSCRHQVADFTGVRAWHAAEFLSSLVAEQT
jgi:FAD/FMN-containing dehydrogenase/Fe-S oxidoreductase